MKNKFKDMTAEECAKYYIKGALKIILFYVISLFIVSAIYEKGCSYILPLTDGGIEIQEIYECAYRVWITFFAIAVVLCVIITLIRLGVHFGNYFGIHTSLCDPEKYIEAEKILCKKIHFKQKDKYTKCRMANAYMSLEDYDNAWEMYKDVIPKDISKCNTRLILEGLSCYYFSIGDMENGKKYLARIEELQSGKKNSKFWGLAINNIKGSLAIDEKKYDEAKEYINKCMEYRVLSNCAKVCCLFKLATIAYETDDYIEAICLYKNVIDMGGKHHYVAKAKEKLEELKKRIE